MFNRGESPLELPCTRSVRVAHSLRSFASLLVTPGNKSSVDYERLTRYALRLARQLRQPLLIDLPLELDDAVDERLGPRRAAGHEHVDGHDLIDALHERVVVEHAADRSAGAHRQHVFRLGHLVV